MILPTHILCKTKTCCTMGGGEKTNHLLLMNDLKLHGKRESEIKGLAPTAEVISDDISLEFGIKNCVVTTINRGKVK